MTEENDSFWSVLNRGLSCVCPRCHKGHIYKIGAFCYDLKDECEHCGLDLTKNDSADGPAVFLMFVIGFAIVPPALYLHALFAWPLFVQIAIWSVIIVALILGMLKPLKSYVITLQYKVRPGDWNA